MNTPNALDIVRAFIEKINAHEVSGLCELMPEEHVFVDSLGTIMRGRETMRAGWTGYFSWFPDYEISVSDIFVHDHFVGLFGVARGTYSTAGKLLDANKWEIPAAWRAVVKDGLIAEWRVYADNSPVLEIMKKYKSEI
jgi:ketosteroid isomerase-like protein